MNHDSRPVPSNPAAHSAMELRREAYTMALYVAICLLGALFALPEEDNRPHPLLIIWGITIGLAVAHWFAFRLSTQLVAAGEVRRSEVALATAQLLGAAAVAVLATIAIVVFPSAVEVLATELLLGVFVAVVGFFASRGGGRSRTGAVIYAIALFVVAGAIALLKNWLAGH